MSKFQFMHGTALETPIPYAPFYVAEDLNHKFEHGKLLNPHKIVHVVESELQSWSHTRTRYAVNRKEDHSY